MVLTYKRYPSKVFTKRDNFYGSEQSRLHTYTKDRHVEEDNGDVQQAKVYQTLAESLGDIASADRLARMGTMVLNKFGQSVQTHDVITTQPITELPFDIRSYLKQAITDGSLSRVWDAIKSIPPTQLSPVARIVQGDIKHDQNVKTAVNDKVLTYQQKLEQFAIQQQDRNNKYGKVVSEIPQRQQEMVERRQEMVERRKAFDAVVNEIISTISKGDTTRGEAFTEVVEKASQEAMVSNAGVAENLTKADYLSEKRGAPSSVAVSNLTEIMELHGLTDYTAGDSKVPRFNKDTVIANLIDIIKGFESGDKKAKTNWQQKLRGYSERADFGEIINGNDTIRDFILHYKKQKGASSVPTIITQLQNMYS